METGLGLFSRSRETIPSPDLDTINPNDKLIILELGNQDRQELLATKLYIYFLVSRSLKEPVLYVKNDSPRVMIFDGRCLFKEAEFIARFVSEDSLLQQVKIFRPVDAETMWAFLYNQLKLQFALNLNLHLVVIITNSSLLFPDLLDKLNRHLFSLKFAARLVLVVDPLIKSQIEYYEKESMCDIMKCQLDCMNDKETKIHITSVKTRSIIEKCIELKEIISKITLYRDLTSEFAKMCNKN